MLALSALLFVTVNSLAQEPGPPRYIPPRQPAPLSDKTLKAAHAFVERELYPGHTCSISVKEQTVGPYRLVRIYVDDDKLGNRADTWTESIYVGPDPQPRSGLDIIVIGRPMQRRQLRAIIDATRFPTDFSAITRVVVDTDGVGIQLGDAYSSRDPSVRGQMYYYRVDGPRVVGRRGSRRLVFETRDGRGRTEASRVTVMIDGRGGLDLTVENLRDIQRRIDKEAYEAELRERAALVPAGDPNAFVPPFFRARARP